MLLATTCSADYGKPWVFPTLGMLSCRTVALLDPADRRPLPVNCERFPYATPGVLYQDGRFLDAIPDVEDSEVVVLADADGVFQRDFDAYELDTLSSLSGGFALGYNLRPGQTGEEEYALLRPKQPLEEAASLLGVSPNVMRGCWIYNTGFMAARASDWRRLEKLFYHAFAGTQQPGDVIGRDGIGSHLFALHSWPQYFICLLLCLNGIPVTELDYGVHSHGHFQLTPKHSIAGRRLYYDNRLVLYAHNVPGVSH